MTSRVVIRTPDQRLRVFVSSTLQELAEERAAARQAITHLRLAPVMFELGARPHPPRDLYRAYLEQSHIFIGLYWQRYGWVAPGMDISGLEDEYQLSEDRPKLIYIKAPAPEREGRLKALLDRIKSDESVSYKSFSTAAELGELIEDDLAVLLTERFETAQLEKPPPPELPDGRPNNLPLQPTPLIGRETEVVAVRNLLLRQDMRLVTLCGVGGIGKSRLALEVAASLLHEESDGHPNFEDGVFFVSLAPIRDPNLVSSAIAQTLGVREAEGRPLLDSLKDYLRNKHILLLLDNFEQVLAAAPLVADLLAAAPHLEILVTSRAVLHLRGEHEFTVPPLTLPNPADVPAAGTHLTSSLSQYEAIRLFVARAQAVKPDFALNDQNAAAVASLCQRLDGLPLAIELAAARVRYYPPQVMLARFNSMLGLLTGGPRDLPSRQQTLRNTIDWSYSLLDENEQRLFTHLGVFAHGCTLEAAEAICSADGDPATGSGQAPDVLQGLSSLVDKSLIQQRDDPSGEPRFILLETIREYALERLQEAGEVEKLRQQHAAFFLALVEEAEPYLTSAQRGPWLLRLEIELDNLRAALDWSITGKHDIPMGLRLGGALTWFWYLRAHLSEGRAWLESGLAQMASLERTAVRAKALYGAGGLAWAEGSYPAARSFLEESLAIRRELGDKHGTAWSLAILGLVVVTQGDPAPALALYRESAALFQEVGDKWGQAFALNAMGDVTVILGDPAAARSLYEESLAMFQELGDPWGRAMLLNALGSVARSQTDYTAARSFYTESATLMRQAGDRRSMVQVLVGLADVTLQQGNLQEAQALCRESLRLWQELGNQSGVILCLAGLARIAAAQGQPERAARLFGAAPAEFKAVGIVFSPSDQADIEHNIAAVRAQLGEAAFSAAWQAGRAMSLEQAIAYALEEPAHA